jgi:glycosyltransferase involved in cell wall biosynthesis
MTSSRPVPLTVIILTFNEALNLSDCLASVSDWVTRVIVVDSGSTDRTVATATRHGAEVVTHPFETHAKQWNWALQNLAIPTEWVLGLDADQRVTPALRDEIARFLAEPAATDREIAGAYVRRRQVFRGRWIRHGGYYPKYLLKLFRQARAWVDERDLVDHHFSVTGKTQRLDHDIVEDNRNEHDVSVWLDKHTRYARLQALEEVHAAGGRPAPGLAAALRGSPDDRVAWRKAFWRRQPLFARSVAYFFYRYVVRLGFLDGKEGFIFHFLQGLWYRLLVDIHIDELRRGRR